LILATAATGYKDGHQILLKLLYMKSIDKLAWIELQNKSILSTKVLERQILHSGGKRKTMKQMLTCKRNSRRANRTT
jgi:hypothetical protein